MEELNEQFLIELFKLSLKRKEICDIVLKHLKYQYLPSAAYKEILKQIEKEVKFTNTLPSLGVLYQNCKDNKEAVKVLEQIKEIEVPPEQQVIASFEEYLKNAICIEFYDNFQETYSKGNRNKARDLLFETGEILHNFTLSSEYLFSSIFANFQDRQYQKKISKLLKNDDFGFVTPVTGIDELDYNYPLKPYDTVLSLGVSGQGKTTLLTFIAVENARRGAKVLYVAAEGTKEEIEDRIDSCWSAIPRLNIERAELEEEQIAKLSQIAEQITSKGGEIEVFAFETFDSGSITDVYNLTQEYKKAHGQPPDVLILDYLELFEPGDGKLYAVSQEKQRRQAIARRVKNLVVSEKIKAGFVATQASNVSAELINSEEFCLTRNDLSADKNLLDSFSLFFSMNQTMTEYNSDIQRLFVDKSRSSSKVNKQLIRIYTDYSHGRYYDRKKSLSEFATSLI